MVLARAALGLGLLMTTFAAGAQDADRDAAIARDNEQREAMRGGIEAVVDAVNAGSFALVAGAIDEEDMLERIFGLRLIDQRVKKQFREGFENWLPATVEMQVKGRQQSPVRATLLGFRSRGNQGLAVVRYDLENFQFAYHEYELSLDRNDNLVIVDWTDFYWGERFSDGVGTSLVMAQPSKQAVRKLVDKQNLSESDMFQLTESLKALRDFQVDRFFEIVGGMDESLARQRVLVHGGVKATKQRRARRQLRTALKAMAGFYPEDPLYTNLLLDYFFPTRRYEDARTSLDALATRLGVEDAVYEARLSSTALVMSDVDEAVRRANKALELEAGLELAWWAALRARAAGNDFAGAVESVSVLATQFGYDLGPEALGKDKSLARFVQSAEYQEWAASRPAPAG